MKALLLATDRGRRIGSATPTNLLLSEGKSLPMAAEWLLDGAIWMDADVLYPPALLARLTTSPHDTCVLLDGHSKGRGEDKDGGHAPRSATHHRTPRGQGLALRRRACRVHHGEGRRRLVKQPVDEEITAERIDQEYEATMEHAFKALPFGYQQVDDVAWTEIDFDGIKAQWLARASV